MPEYGPIISGRIVEDAVIATIRQWMNAYIGEASVQAGLARIGGDAVPRPTDVARSSDVDWNSGDKLPLVLVGSPGLVDDAMREADDLTLTWDVRVATVATAQTRERTRTCAQVYAAAAGACLQNKGIALDDAEVRFASESYYLVASRSSRTLMAGEVAIEVKVPGARSRFGGPIEPPDTPGDRPIGQPGPNVLTTHVDVDARPLGEEE